MANHNPRRAKINRNYTVEEISELFAIHKNTVRNWLKAGLPSCVGVRPTLVLGIELRMFLDRRRSRNKSPCGPGRMYCCRCRQPVSPANNSAWLEISESGVSGRLRGECAQCSCRVYRRVSLSKKSEWQGNLQLTETQA